MAIQATSEEQLRLKKRARQRLLGAATLLISAAIILPMVLDQAPRPLNSDIAINMPGAAVAAPAAVLTPVPAMAAPVTANTNQAVNPVTDKPEPAIKAEPAQVATEPMHPDTAQQKAIAEAKQLQQQEAQHKADEAKSALAAEKAKQAEQAKLAHDKEVAHQAALTAEKVQQAAKAKQAAAASAPQPASIKDNAAHNTTADHAPAVDNRQADASVGRYVVQLGAFSSAENVRQLRERLSAVGVSTYTENLPSGATRVRAGPFAERGQADKALAKISAAGIQAQIVPLAHK